MKIKSNRKPAAFPVVMLVITALYIAFIWIHSTMSAEISSIESGNVMEFLNNILRSVGLPADITDHIVRKSAHFCEFALLGFLTVFTAHSVNKRIIKNLMSVSFVCLATAVIDEFIQIFSDGRSAEVADVMLDFSGSVCGGIFIIVILLIIRLVRKR